MDQGDATGDLLKGLYLSMQNGLVDALDELFILPHTKTSTSRMTSESVPWANSPVDLAVPVLKLFGVFVTLPRVESLCDLLAGRPFGAACAEIDQLPEKFDGQILKLQSGGIRAGMLSLPILPNGNQKLLPQGTPRCCASFSMRLSAVSKPFG